MLQSTLARIKENVRVPMQNMGTAVQLTSSISFTIWKDDSVDYGPDLFLRWRGKRLSISSVKELEDVRRIEIIGTYGKA